jgi:hypothetical protein
MSTDGSFYSKLTRKALAAALAATVVAGVGLSTANADDGRGPHDNGNHNDWSKNKKRDKRDKNEKGRVRAITQNSDRYATTYNTPVTPLDKRHRSRRSAPSYNDGRYNGGYYNGYPNNGYNNGRYNNGRYNNGRYYGYPSNGGYYNGYPNNGYYNGGYNNGGYYDNRRGDLDAREVAERGSYYGYYDGFYRGQYDRQQGVRRPNPQGHGAYQFALNGWERDWGSANTFQQYYRQSFMRGYQDGYGQGSYRNQYKRRW